ncbi:MAG: hypothetical protein HZC18_05065 [Candidatus Omnitrophica bacterium]|nr:hypothetical protein [Candidatus Omnitrophota bacterium]
MKLMRYHLSAPCVDLQTREIERRSTLRVRKMHGRSDVIKDVSQALL